MKRCPDCRRPLANPLDWAAFEAQDIGACTDDACAWGGDRCWNEGWCGILPGGDGPRSVGEIARRGSALRRGRPLTRVPHAEAHQEVS